MSQRQIDEQIRQAFSALTTPPRPQLTERIRDSLWGRPATPRPRALPPLRAALVAVLLVVALVAALLAGPAAVRTASAIGRGVNGAVSRALTPPRTAVNPTQRPTATARPSPSATATATPTPTPTATPTPAPTETPAPAPTPPPATAPVATLAGFSCSTQTGGGGQTALSTARVGAQSGYDRFVIQFAGPVPRFEVTLQTTPSFGQVTLAGTAGLQVVLHDASAAGTYSGPDDMRPGYPQIQEARLLSDSQGVVQWGVGISHAACFHAWVLPNPSRLVVDIAV